VRGKVRRFRAAMPPRTPALRGQGQPDRRVLKVLVQEGAGFEIASTAELELLLGLGVAPAEIFFSNPVKSRESIAYAAAKAWSGSSSTAPTSCGASTRPGRMPSSTCGSPLPTSAATGRLSGKFGAGAADAREIVALAAKLGTDLAA